MWLLYVSFRGTVSSLINFTTSFFSFFLVYSILCYSLVLGNYTCESCIRWGDNNLSHPGCRSEDVSDQLCLEDTANERVALLCRPKVQRLEKCQTSPTAEETMSYQPIIPKSRHRYRLDGTEVDLAVNGHLLDAILGRQYQDVQCSGCLRSISILPRHRSYKAHTTSKKRGAGLLERPNLETKT